MCDFDWTFLQSCPIICPEVEHFERNLGLDLGPGSALSIITFRPSTSYKVIKVITFEVMKGQRAVL